MRNFFRTHPATTALGLTAFYFLVLAAPGFWADRGFGNDPEMTPQQMPLDQVPVELLLAASALAIVWFLGWGRSARITSRPDWTGLWYVLPPLAFTFLILTVGFILPGLQTENGLALVWQSGLIQSLLLLSLLVGVFEEVMFRGIVMHGLEQRFGGLVALIASSVIFGAMHYVNFIDGQSLGATNKQVLHAAGVGLLYGALALRIGSIWPGVLLHALWDATVALAGMGADAPDSGTGHGILLFVIQNFELLFGAFVTVMWLRHRRAAREIA
ncbi:CPBP family intramembrane glutamic endopeptidase [Pseudoruegeria sp. SHC-113]|uniref:CPBP family intramembrane glutamic endopeptidase n=1 Tax=Pseudoruegeria sp. SHC-113 TaxID=2855439 RepID=UPI0021BAB1FA|nr:CPBP family intramembrane glutamic endopeptidase [Pseudoruegeria sp. SHC-113]MCT8162087.1 CPBP family intramembrane metalloprotease [Pseudoruegeria sp. SHC-113]